ncbi:MAG: hypothetical protein ACP5QD_03980, partial [Candidatus Ratteibacteria bacterium]
DEYHLTFVPTGYETVSELTALITKSYKKILRKLALDSNSAVFRRFFCSDLINQYQTIRKYPVARSKKNDECAISFISQSPYPEVKIAMWAYHIIDRNQPILKSIDGNGLKLKRKSLTHFWDTGIMSTEEQTVHFQTMDILLRYKKILANRSMKLADNVIRTWFFVRNIDTDYMEFAKARKEFFEKNGLTPGEIIHPLRLVLTGTSTSPGLFELMEVL